MAFMCWCAVKKLLTHSLTLYGSSVQVATSVTWGHTGSGTSPATMA